MATSGTVGQTNFQTITWIEQAHRLCRVPTQGITRESITSARIELSTMLQAWANDGINLWTVKKLVLPQVIERARYPLPPGTINVLKLLRREVTDQGTGGGISEPGGEAENAFDKDFDTTCDQTGADGYIGFVWQSPRFVHNVGVMANGDQTFNLVIEYSEDAGTTWRELQSFDTTTFPDRTFVYNDIDGPQLGDAIRIRETGGATLTVREVVFGSQPAEIEVTRQNRDDYYNQTSKTDNSDPTLFWFDRQIQPQMWIWPTPLSDFKQLVVWYTTQIEDVVALSDEIAIPARWSEALKYGLAFRLAPTLDGVDQTRINWLEQQEAKHLRSVRNAERDSADMSLVPNISGYTR